MCFSYVKVGVASLMVERCGEEEDGSSGDDVDHNKNNNNKINSRKNNEVDNYTQKNDKKLKIVFGNSPEEAKNSNKKKPRWREMVNCGVATQIGSLIGALTSFVLVNVCHVFKS